MLERLTRIVAVALFLEDGSLTRRVAADPTKCAAGGDEEAAACSADTRLDMAVYYCWHRALKRVEHMESITSNREVFVRGINLQWTVRY